MPGSCLLIHPCNDTKTENKLKLLEFLHFFTVHEQESKTSIVEISKGTFYLWIPFRNNRRLSSSQRVTTRETEPFCFLEDSHRLRGHRLPSSTRATDRDSNHRFLRRDPPRGREITGYFDEIHREGENSSFPSKRTTERERKTDRDVDEIDRRRYKPTETSTRSTEMAFEIAVVAEEERNQEEKGKKERKKEKISTPPFLSPIALRHVSLRSVTSWA